MSKRTQKDSGEERVTAKSKPMMNLVSRCSERTPDVVPSTASESPEETRHESQFPLSSIIERRDPLYTHTPHGTQSGTLIKLGLLKSGILMERGDPFFFCPQGGAHQFVIEDDETEADLSLGSKSFLHRVNDRVRERQKRSSMNVKENSEEHSVIWRMFMSSTLQASVLGEELLRQLALRQKYKRSYNVRHIWEVGVRKIRWDLCSENNKLGKLFMEVFVFDWWWTSHQSSAHKSLRIFGFCIVSWKDEREPSIKYSMGRKDWRGSKVHRNIEPWIELMVSQINSSGISSQDSPRCSLATKFKSYCWDWVKHQRIVQDGLSSCRCSTTFYGDQKTTRKNASQMLNSFLYLQKDSEQDNGHSLDLDQRKSGILSVKIVHKVNGTVSLNWWWSNSEKADTQFSEPRAHCPEECSKAKAAENCRSTNVPTRKRLQLFFAQLFL